MVPNYTGYVPRKYFILSNRTNYKTLGPGEIKKWHKVPVPSKVCFFTKIMLRIAALLAARVLSFHIPFLNFIFECLVF